MGFADKIKGAYFFFEDKWYSVLDKINTKIPVYKAVDPIDRVIPSFILFLLVVLFILILAGYFIQFSSPYEVTIITKDSSTQVFLSGVIIDGELNGEVFDGSSNSDGEYSFQVTGVSKNFFGLLGEIIFPTEPSFEGYVNATKTGYVEIKDKTIDFTSTKHTISLEALPTTAEYPNSTVVELRDAVTEELIVSSDSLAYVKFKCNNKTITTKTVRDDADGTKDGKYTLAENQCHFVVTSAFSPGYGVDSIQKVLPTNKETHKILLTKSSVPTTGTAKVYVYDINSPDTNRDYLEGIKVYFNSTQASPQYAFTNTTGVAEKILEAGTYTITISDDNYYAITSSDNITIDITANNPTQISIGLEKIKDKDRRQIYFKIVNIDGNVLPQVNVDLLWLNVDANGNYFGTNGVLPATYNSGASTPTHTDSNGLFKATNVTVQKEGQLIAILRKDNYVYKIVEPKFFKLTEGPETIIMEIATEANSGKAEIIVNAGDNNRPLANAKAYLYTDLVTASHTVTGIPFEKDGQLTNVQGIAWYSSLPVSLSSVYSAEARFLSVSSGISPKKSLDANQTIVFNLHLNLNVSYLEIELYDFASRTKITNNLSSANIKLYTVGDSDFSSRELSENITLISNKFISTGYDQRSRLLLTVDLNGYASQTITLDGVTQPLAPGNNNIKVFLIPRTMLNGDVDIFFDNIYSDSDVVLDGNSSVIQIDPSQTYKLRFFAVIDGNKDFEKLLALQRTLGKTSISGVDGMQYLLKEQDAFTCDTTSLDSITRVHDDNYYFPTGTACTLSGSQTRPQAGFNWNNADLPIGTYSYIVTFNVNSDANLGDLIKVQYRAKEKHDTNLASETELKEVTFEIGKPLLEGIYLSVKIDNIPVIFNLNSDISEQVRITPNNKNEIKIIVNNNTNESISNATLKIFSHAGNTAEFNQPYTGSGLIHFDDRNGPKQKTLKTALSLNAFRSDTSTADAYPEKFNSSNWIVIVFEEAGNKQVKFIDAKAWGKTLSLDAEFIAGIENQPFDGTVYPRAGSGSVVLTSATVEVTKDCMGPGGGTLDDTINATPTDLDGDRFEVTIQDMYEYGVDCVYVSATAVDSDLSYSFDPIDRKRIMATSGSGRDPALSCVDITDSEGNDIDSTLEWGETDWFNVRNNCESSVNVILETGLVCTNEDSAGCSIPIELGVGGSTIYNLKGENADYDSGYPDFKDTIGLFPIFVKAKFVGRTGASRWVVADSIDVHLEKESGCFSISGDKFDFITSGGADIPYNITNNCQYLDNKEYFYPKTVLRAFGFENISLNTPPLVPQSFNASLEITGNTYETYYEDTNIIDYLSSSIVINAPDLTPIELLSGLNRYENVKFDLDETAIENLVGETYWAMTKFQFQFFDKNPILDGELEQPYGIMIDGNIKVNYVNGTFAYVTPHVNFSITPTLSCVGPGTGIERCELTKSGTDLGDNNLDVGLIYVIIPKGKVDSIDMNLIGGLIAENLTMRLSPYLDYTRRDARIREDVAAGETNTTVELGTYSIYPIEGAEFYVTHINDIDNFEDAAFTEKINPRMYVSSSNPEIVTWIEQGYLKAKYIGTNIGEYDDKTINMTMRKTFGGGINYSILNIADFVSKTVAYQNGKEISGE